MPKGLGFRHGHGWWHGRLRGCGRRITIPRQAVLDILTGTQEHLSTEEIHQRVNKLYPTVGLASVYRTLELLVQMGIVSKFDFGDGRSRYELVEGPKGILHHHHLVCTDCSRIIDYTDFVNEEKDLLNRAEKGLSKKYEFDIRHHSIQFYGFCKACKATK